VILLLAVAGAAAVGAVSRYLLDSVVQHRLGRAFPWGTVVINVSGSLLLGLVTGLATHAGLPAVPATVLGTGFLGGYTTWSTYLWETLALAEGGAPGQAALNLLGSLAAGLVAAAVGFALSAL
jgi:fluoride exporter